MTWNPAFDWATASSFNGERRLFSVLTSITEELNARAECVDESTISLPEYGAKRAFVRGVEDKFLALLTSFGTTIGDIETEIGTSSPLEAYPGRISPTWVNWLYQAINLLECPVECALSEYWDGVTLGATTYYSDLFFDNRWTTYSAGDGSINVNAGEIVFSDIGENLSIARYWLGEARFSTVKDSVEYVEIPYDITSFHGLATFQLGIARVGIFYSTVNRTDSIFIQIPGASPSEIEITWSSAYVSGTFSATIESGDIVVRHNSTILRSETTAGLKKYIGSQYFIYSGDPTDGVASTGAVKVLGPVREELDLGCPAEPAGYKITLPSLAQTICVYNIGAPPCVHTNCDSWAGITDQAIHDFGGTYIFDSFTGNGNEVIEMAEYPIFTDTTGDWMIPAIIRLYVSGVDILVDIGFSLKSYNSNLWSLGAIRYRAPSGVWVDNEMVLPYDRDFGNMYECFSPTPPANITIERLTV